MIRDNQMMSCAPLALPQMRDGKSFHFSLSRTDERNSRHYTCRYVTVKNGYD